MDANALSRLTDIYRDIHAHPELSMQENRTAGIVKDWLAEHGFEVHAGIGRTGVVGVLVNGDGPVVAARADMDALPVAEQTGLPYSSTVDGVMHACGHDMHTTWLMGATAELAADRDSWKGTLVAIFQPGEETFEGAKAMVDDDIFSKVPRPSVLLAQHTAPLPAGLVALQPGAAFAASDALKITLFGAGGHGSRPEATIDPVVMAASLVLRLQTIVSREIPSTDVAVVTVGALNAGAKANVIPDTAELLLTIRTYDAAVREKILSSIERIAKAEAAASGATKEPTVENFESSPALVNDPAACDRTRPALAGVVGADHIMEPGPGAGSEDAGELATGAGAPIVYWLLGATDPALFADAKTQEQFMGIVEKVPANHSPHFAPVIDPTLELGVKTMVAATKAWLQ